MTLTNRSLWSSKTCDRPFYLRLIQTKYGAYELQYRSAEDHPWVKLMPVTEEQADWVHSDGWPIVREDKPT